MDAIVKQWHDGWGHGGCGHDGGRCGGRYGGKCGGCFCLMPDRLALRWPSGTVQGSNRIP